MKALYVALIIAGICPVARAEEEADRLARINAEVSRQVLAAFSDDSEVVSAPSKHLTKNISKEEAPSSIKNINEKISKIEADLADNDKWFQLNGHQKILEEKASAQVDLDFAEKLAYEVKIRYTKPKPPYGSTYRYSAEDSERMLKAAKTKMAEIDYKLAITQKEYARLLPMRQSAETELYKLKHLQELYLAPEKAAKEAASFRRIRNGALLTGAAVGGYFLWNSYGHAASVVDTRDFKQKKLDRRPALSEPLPADTDLSSIAE